MPSTACSRDTLGILWRTVPVLFLHINLILALYTGAALATAARLKWDPITYMVIRNFFPAEYRMAAVVLCLTAVIQLVLGHLAAATLLCSRAAVRRVLFTVYAFTMAVLMCVEMVWCGWTTWRIFAWLHSTQSSLAMDLLNVGRYFHSILEFLGYIFELQYVMDLIAEAKADAPRNLYVGGAAAALLAVLQSMAVALALLAARSSAVSAAAPKTRAKGHTNRCISNDETPLKTTFKNGRLVIISQPRGAPSPPPLPAKHPAKHSFFTRCVHKITLTFRHPH